MLDRLYSPQVYGRAEPSKATYIGIFKNTPCTSLHFVADLFPYRSYKTWNSCADYQVAASKAFMRKIA